MLKLSNAAKTLLLAASFLLLTACNSKSNSETNTTAEQNPTTETDINTGGSDDNGTGGAGDGTDDGNTTAGTGSGTDDNTTDTPTITLTSLNLTIEKTSLNKDENTTVKVMATYSDNTNKEVTDKVEWMVTPSDAVKVTNTTLTALKDVGTTVKAKMDTVTSDAVNLNIYWEVNGHTLPPEPDPAINNATLLGVDVNDNGVRDDVERYIIIKEAKNPNFPKTWTVITLQFAWAWQKMIGTPTIESRKFLEDVSACREYFIDKYTKHMNYQDYRTWRKIHSSLLGVDLEDKLFNTKERIQQRFKFNEACSGNIFDLRKAEIGACKVNVDELGE